MTPLLVAALFGLLIGLSLGVLGGGGSILTVPVLVYVIGESAHRATAASLVIVGISALTGMAVHARAGRVRLRSGALFGVIGVAGSVAGAQLSGSVDPQLLLALFAGLMLAAAVAMLRRTRRTDPLAADRIPGATPRPSALRIGMAATAVGLITGFFGVGGGFIVVPALVLALGYAMPVAVGTSLLVIAINSAAALVTRLAAGAQLDWSVILLFSATAAIGSIAGSLVAGRVRPRRLATGFVVLLVVLAGYMLARSLPHLL